MLFAILFAWVSAGFWTALAGFWLLARGNDRYAISRHQRGDGGDRHSAGCAHRDRDADLQRGRAARVRRPARDVRVAARAPARSTASTSSCCPTPATPDTRVAELDAWLALCRSVDGFGRVFYRWRQHRIKRKSGNIADFCRRWGRKYRYMVVLDADSVMTGDCLTSLVRMPKPIPTPASSRPRRAPRAATRCTRASSSSPPASTARCSPPACISGSSANRTTGATTRSSASRRSSAIARSAGCPDAARCRARSCRTISSRRR